MAGTGLGEIVADLLVFAQSVTGYAPPAMLPEVIFLPRAQLEQRACDRPCDVYGWYSYGSIIYLDDRLDPAANLVARAILLHEIVHYLQHSADAFADKSDCNVWIGREREAYRVQTRWLVQYNVNPESMPSVQLPPQATCPEE